MATLLISQTYLQSKSIINDNADWEMIKPVIKMVQDLYLQDLLGTDLYVKLQTEIIGGTLAGSYKTLVDNYIQDYLHWMIVAHVSPIFKFRYMNKGIVENGGGDSNVTSTDDLKYITTQWLNYAEKYGNNITKYLNANSTLFPEFLSNSTLDKTLPSSTGFDSPFYFEGENQTISINGSGSYRNRDSYKKQWWE